MNRRDLFKLAGLGIIGAFSPKFVQAKLIEATERLHAHPAIPKAWAQVGADGVVTAAYNVARIKDVKPREFTVEFMRPMKDSEYVCIVTF